MRWMVMAAMVACGGGDGTNETGESNTNTDSERTPNSVVDCNALPTYNINGMGCEELADAFYGQADSEAARACDTADDCRAIKTPCEHWDDISGCWWVVNVCFTNSMLNEYDSLSQGCFVETGIRQNSCECAGVSAPEVQCKNNKCSEVFTYPVR